MRNAHSLQVLPAHSLNATPSPRSPPADNGGLTVVTVDISDATRANILSIHNKGQLAVCTFSAGTVTRRDDDM